MLNQWLMSLFGIDPLAETMLAGRSVRPFRLLADPLMNPQLEGLDDDNLHRFYRALVGGNFFKSDRCVLDESKVLSYEENIVRHTGAINKKRRRPVVWKYFQWLALLFVEIYLDRFFSDREGLLKELNDFVDRFNRRWKEFAATPRYTLDELNKLCFQNATGSGKTLLMHVNLLQYRSYAEKHGKDKDLSGVILLTPNERLSEQHIGEFRESGIQAGGYIKKPGELFKHVDVLEITKLAEREGPTTIAVGGLGDRNLLFVDEGHRGMSGKEEGVWFSRRGELCGKGFTFEYSATFEQAVHASGSVEFENSYAKAVIFDYSYRWFYEDGFGKDYQILNLPKSFDETQSTYLTACLLKFYQQLRIYEAEATEIEAFNLEKPLWVFVGNTVSGGKPSRDEQLAATDVALIIRFIADFLDDRPAAQRRINEILIGKGRDTGLLDTNGNDIFAGAFSYLARTMNDGDTVESLYKDILARLFNNPAGGILLLERIKGESGEVALRVGTSDIPFGLINVGDAKGLCDHVSEVAARDGIRLTVTDSDFTETMFAAVKDSTSPVNLLIGSKKFVEGWDCWRVSTMGLMHVGRSEGAQIIQLFGRGVRLKGYEWSLKRSGHSHAPNHPRYIEELETLNVFGIEADFMEKFRQFLKEEGLPGNERRETFTIPLNVTYDFGKKLRILRPKRKISDGKEYDFKKDAPVPTLGSVPDYLIHNPIVVDWYPRIQTVQSRGTSTVALKDQVILHSAQLAFLDYDALFFELERFKRDRAWHNFNISKSDIKNLLSRIDWYKLFLPETKLKPTGFDGILLLQQVATELLKRYCDRLYNYRKREFIEPRLELRDLLPDDGNLPAEKEYKIIVNADEEQVIQGIKQLKRDLEERKRDLVELGDLKVCNFGKHLFQPLIHVKTGGKITVSPVTLNDSEYDFVSDLKSWCDSNHARLERDGWKLFLLRNLSRNRGVGFFEAGNFYPDFIFWIVAEGKQYINFIEPHGLMFEDSDGKKVLFFERIKEVEKRLNDPAVVLNSFILSWTKYSHLKWRETYEDLVHKHILFMKDDRDRYIDKLSEVLGVFTTKRADHGGHGHILVTKK